MLKAKVENICCIGAGYVGGPTMAVIADKCNEINVTVVDIDKERISKWNDSNLENLPVYEPGLREIIKRVRNKNLFFETNIRKAIEKADIVFISVNTPTKTTGFGAGYASDLKWVEASARQVSEYAIGHTIVVEKSTLPVRTAKVIKEILINSFEDNSEISERKTFSVLSNPEFLAEGTAINDLNNPDRVLIGGEDEDAINSLKEVYKYWVEEEIIITTNLWSSELSKLAANAFLAQRISSINSISAICEATGAEVNEVAKAIGTDKRIGSRFLSSGPGFGGSCFKKDILNLVYLCKYFGLGEVAEYWEQVVTFNDWHTNRISRLIVEKLFDTVAMKKILILGFAYKANTNDTRESPAIKIVRDLLENGAQVIISDPKVDPNTIAKDLDLNEDCYRDGCQQGKWKFTNEIYEAANGADAVVIITEWPIYKNLLWNKIVQLMRKPAWLFDTRSLINYEDIKDTSINYWSIGNSNNI